MLAAKIANSNPTASITAHSAIIWLAGDFDVTAQGVILDHQCSAHGAAFSLLAREPSWLHSQTYDLEAAEYSGAGAE